MPNTVAEALDEAVLWEKFRRGDAQALDTLAALHYRALFNYGTKFSPGTEFVKDCIQDLFLELWKNRAGLGKAASVRQYLLKSLRRKIIRETQREQRLLDRNAALDNYCFTVEFSGETEWIAEEQGREQAEQLRQGLAKLSARQREAIYLRFYQDLSSEEAASVMGIGKQSVYNLVHDALEGLKKHILPAISVLLLLLFQSAAR